MAGKAWTRRDKVLWLAGLLDGEGYFGKYQHARTQRVDLWLTDRDIAQTAAMICEVACKPRCKSSYRDGKKPQFGFTLTGERARRVMRMVFPFMHSRRQAAIAEAFVG